MVATIMLPVLLKMVVSPKTIA